MQNETPIFEKKNVLVTGGAGFLGSHLCERLLKEAKVICMDDLSNSHIQNIQHLLQYPDFEFIKYDVNQPIDINSFPELGKFIPCGQILVPCSIRLIWPLFIEQNMYLVQALLYMASPQEKIIFFQKMRRVLFNICLPVVVMMRANVLLRPV